MEIPPDAWSLGWHQSCIWLVVLDELEGLDWHVNQADEEEGAQNWLKLS